MDFVGLAIAVIGLLGTFLKWYLGRDKTYEATQRGRSDIQNGNTGAVSERVDRVLADQAGTADNPAGEPSAEDVERRISQL